MTIVLCMYLSCHGHLMVFAGIFSGVVSLLIQVRFAACVSSVYDTDNNYILV